MKKEILIIAGSILFFACGSNAENNNSQQEITNQSITIEEEVVEEVILEKDEVELQAQEDELIETIKVVTKEELVEETKVVEKEVPVEVKSSEPVIAKKADYMLLKAEHSNWDALLKKNVTATGKVNYKGMKASLPKIQTYLAHLKRISPQSNWSKNEKLAYWINLYNASTVYLIASNYPTTSITKLNGGKPWDKKFVKSGDKVYSLNQIENEIVRPRFKEPRIHAALNCAAISCPNLLNEAFVADKLNAQLSKQSKVWVNDSSKNKLTGAKVSKIFEWYAADFKAGGGVIAFINKYATTKISTSTQVSYLEYDWALNE